MSHIAFPSPLVILVRVVVSLGIPYLSVIGTWKLVAMLRLVKASEEHTETLSAHTRAMKAHSKQLAAAIQLLAGPEPPASSGPLRLVEKKKADAMARVVSNSKSILLEEDGRAN